MTCVFQESFLFAETQGTVHPQRFSRICVSALSPICPGGDPSQPTSPLRMPAAAAVFRGAPIVESALEDEDEDLLNAFTLLFPGDEQWESGGPGNFPAPGGLAILEEGARTSNTFHNVLSMVSPSKRERIAASLAAFGQVRKSSELLHARFSSGRCVSLLLSNCSVVTVTLDADGIAVVDCRIHTGLAAAVEAEVGPGEALCCAGFLAAGFCVLCSRNAKMILAKPRRSGAALEEWDASALRTTVTALQHPALQITVNADQVNPKP